MSKEGRDEKGRFTEGNIYGKGVKNWNGGRPNSTGLPSVNDVGKKEYNRVYMKYKRSNDKSFAIMDRVSSLVRSVLNLNSERGEGVKYLGLTGKEYRIYLEGLFDNKMTWDNYGEYWEVDHIIPKSSFNMLDEYQVKKCFNYKNTRPLQIEKNRKKSNIYNPNNQYKISL